MSLLYNSLHDCQKYLSWSLGRTEGTVPEEFGGADTDTAAVWLER